jgi:hypothetical protein
MSKKSLRAEKTPPRKSATLRQMVDFKGFPLSAENGDPLISERETYSRREYSAEYAVSVVLNSISFRRDGINTQNVASRGGLAALPIVERFEEETPVSSSLLGTKRETTQIGLFQNVSSYGLDEKDWRIEQTLGRSPGFWYGRPSSSGNYYESKYEEDNVNAAIVITSNPSPFTPPPFPDILQALRGPTGAVGWARYINSIVALNLIKYMVENFTPQQKIQYNLELLLQKYPPIPTLQGGSEFNELYWDKIWLDIEQNRFGPQSGYPTLPTGSAYNFSATGLSLPLKSASLWGEQGNPEVLITEAGASLPDFINYAWNTFLFNTTRIFFPEGREDNKGHYRLQTNPTPSVWEKYFGLKWQFLRQDLKDWKFTVHSDESTITQVEKDLKLPYFLLSTPKIPDRTLNTFSSTWPSAVANQTINLPAAENVPGGARGVSSQVIMSSVRPFRYQPGRISGFTYGVKVSEIGAGPGTTIEWGIENDTDSYIFRLEDGARFSIVRRSTVPIDNTQFLSDSGYEENTKVITRNGRRQFETVIDQSIMNGDALGGEGESGYIIDLDTVTMYKIEFGWYGAIGAKFYVYIPQDNGNARWVVLHTLVIENQLRQPCLADPFFYFKYRLIVGNSSSIRLRQSLYKFGASYYIDGADKGTVYLNSANSKERLLSDPKFSVSKTSLNAIDWTVLIGIKPKQFLLNRSGVEIFNKKQIFPVNFSVLSEQDCEIKIIRQRACPEFAYTHQEGYRWQILSPPRRLRGKFSINPLFNFDFPALEISQNNPSTHTAIATYNSQSLGGFRDISDEGNWAIVTEESPRIIGDDLFSMVAALRDFEGDGVSLRLEKTRGGSQVYLSSRDTKLLSDPVGLPSTYAPVPPYEDGYDIEIDYFRRDQLLLSSVDILSNEFYIYWVGGAFSGVDSTHASSIRFGFSWPSKDPQSSLYQGLPSLTWGIEQPEFPLDYVEYDGEKFYEGLPHDLGSEFSSNSLFVEANYSTGRNTFGLETSETYGARISSLYNLKDDGSPSVLGAEGGTCRGLRCLVDNVVIDNVPIIQLEDEIYYLSSTTTLWPNINEEYVITIYQDSISVDIETTGGITRQIDNATVFLLPIGEELPEGINAQFTIRAEYNNVYIGSIDVKSLSRNVLASKIAPGNLPFFRVWVQGRQGARLGGVWIGQKSSRGITLDPLTPHRSTFSISDSATIDRHGQWEDSISPPEDGAVKVITPITQVDQLGLSTAPTFNSSEASLSTLKSIHTSPKKCGSFLSPGDVNSAAIFTAGSYPVRWLTSPNSGSIISTYYASANTSTSISLRDIFDFDRESVVNDGDANLATFFIARSLSNHEPEGKEKEIYMTLNYEEQ